MIPSAIAFFAMTVAMHLYSGWVQPQPKGMVLVPATQFWMGGADAEEGGLKHQVRLAPFFIDRMPVTFEDYDAYCAAVGAPLPEDAGWGRGKRPVVNITWKEAQSFCRWSGKRLPTEAEYELAASGGEGAALGALDEVAWYAGNSGGQTHPVGQKNPNSLGVYDALGNVWEWTADWYDPTYYAQSPSDEPLGPAEGQHRVLRGGSWQDPADKVSPSFRYDAFPGLAAKNIGCRCAKSR